MTSAGYLEHRMVSRNAKRRVRALAARGWSINAQATELGMSVANLWRVMDSRFVSPTKMQAIAEMYERLWNKQPKTRTAAQAWAMQRTMTKARRSNWVPPLAWDDIDTDRVPPTTPKRNWVADVDEIAVDLAVHGESVQLGPADRREAVRVLHAKKYSDPRIAAILGCADRTVWKIRGELGLQAYPFEELEMERAS